MKSTFSLFYILFFYSVFSQVKYQKNINPFSIYPEFQKFDFEKNKNDYTNLPYDSSGVFRMLSDGTIFRAEDFNKTDIWYHVIPSKSYVTLNYNFYPSGNLKEFGQFANFDAYVTKIGIWKTYDENGKLIKMTDEDIKFKKFTFSNVLEFMQEKGHIDLETGKNRTITSFYFDPKEEIWELYVQTYYNEEVEEKGIRYIINCKKGKLKKTLYIEKCLYPFEGLCEKINREKKPKKNHVYETLFEQRDIQ